MHETAILTERPSKKCEIGRERARASVLPPTCMASVAPMLGDGAAIGCCPLALKDPFTGGRSLREQLVKTLSSCCAAPASMCRCTQSGNKCPCAKGRLRLRTEYFWTDCSAMLKVSFLCLE